MVTKKFMLYFPKSETEKPIIYHLVKDYNLIINIFRAKITPEEEGFLVIDVTGEQENIDKAMVFLSGFDVQINTRKKGLIYDSTKCTHCGNCLSHCPTQALFIENHQTMEVIFRENLCIECLACVKNCPYNACSSLF
ncbi:MAG: 4Fe-4S binding protein [Spirochaetales bacterium]|nr:4Fe-4S binding protein [Spirochaetales bacterium]